MTADWQRALSSDGYAILPGVLNGAEVTGVLAEWAGVCLRHPADPAILAGVGGPAYGARNLLRLWPGVIDLARRPGLLNPLLDVLGTAVGLVRGLFFDKPPGNSWALPWHRDYNVAVVEHRSFGVFTKPTMKAGVPHVEAPRAVLERMVTARVHLDGMTDENGPLRVIPGSQHEGEGGSREPVTIHCHAGDVLLMRPLLSHSSGHCRPDTATHRRVVHLECAADPELPDGYRWHDFVRLAE
jgi:hypothetical protein